MPLSDRRIQSLRMFGVLAALLLCTFGWIAILTFSPEDPPNPAVYPHADPVRNGCGRVGAWMSFHLFHAFGEGVFPMAIFLSAAAGALFVRRRIGELPLRAAGLAVFTLATAALSALTHPEPSGSLIEGRGGIVGIAAAGLLTDSFSNLMASLILCCLLLLGLLLMADDLLTRLPAGIRWLRTNGWAGLWQGAQGGGFSRGQLTPVMIGAGNTAGRAASRRQAEGDVAEVDEDNDEESEETDRDVEGEVGDEVEGKGSSESGAVDGVSDNTPQGSPLAGGEEGTEAEAEDDPTTRDLVIKMLGKERVQTKAPLKEWPKLPGEYELPAITLLGDPEIHYAASQESVVRAKAAVLERTLKEFRIEGRIVEIDTGPVITLFEVELAPGIKYSQVSSLSNDIARALKSPAVRVVATLPGKNTIGIEVPNSNKEKVRLKELMQLGGHKPTKMNLPIFLGKDASGNPLILDITSMPHMLIAGTTGSGKSVCINSIIMAFLMTQRPDHLKLILIDPKMVELSVFKEIPHLMCPIVTDMARAEKILEWATTKMDERYELLAEAAVRDIASFNKLGEEEIFKRFQPTNDEEKQRIPTHLPYIVIVIDELADLMMTSGKEVEHHLARLAQKSRAVGIHLLVATQRPQANVVTGLIKSNLPCRVAFRVASRMDSRIVLDQNGAEVLMGEGDMLLLPPGTSKLLRSQGTYIEDDELKAVLVDLSGKAQPQFHHELMRMQSGVVDDTGERDPMFDEAVSIIVQSGRGSVSLLQRRLNIGYSRASRLIDQMAADGLVGDYKGSQAREVLITEKEWQAVRKQRERRVEEEAAVMGIDGSGGGYEDDAPFDDD